MPRLGGRDGPRELERLRAIEGDERTRRAVARRVDDAGREVLAGAGFAFDQHRNGRAGGTLELVEGGLHGRGAGCDVGEREPAVATGLDAAQGAFEGAELEGVAERDHEPFGDDGLDEEVERAAPHRSTDRLERRLRGLDDHGDGDAVRGPSRPSPPCRRDRA